MPSKNKSIWPPTSAGSIEGTAVLSTGEGGGTKYLREDGDGTSSWQSVAGGGDLVSTNNLNDVANAATSRTNLDVDQAGTDNSTDVTTAGAGTYVSLAGQVLTIDPITESDISDLGSYSVTGHTHTLGDYSPFQAVTASLGSVEIDGGATGGYEGYSIGGRVVLAHDNGTIAGLWSDTSSEWLFRCDVNGANTLYYDGVAKLQTDQFGIDIDEIRFEERADHGHTSGAGEAFLWVKNTAPSTLIFTDDGGTDHDLTASGGAEVNDLSSVVTWANIPDANVPQSAVTQHEAALDHDALTNFDANEHADITGTVSVTGNWTFNDVGDGGITSYDIEIGDTDGSPTYGIARFGNSIMGRTSYNSGNLDIDGCMLFRNVGAPATSNIETLWVDGTNSIRFALAVSGTGNATYNPRSMLIAGPAILDDTVVTVGYWQSQGIFDNLVCNTSGDGADLGVQNDLEVEGDIFVDSILESTTAAGVTVENVLIKDGLVDGINIATDVAANTAKVSNATHTGDVTGTTALTIAPSAVDIAMMSASGTPSASTYLRGDNTWSSIAGGGDVSKVGTPVDNEIGVWTGDGTLEGDTNFTWNGSVLGVAGDIQLGDAQAVELGASQDLVLEHSGAFGSLTNNTGNYILRQSLVSGSGFIQGRDSGSALKDCFSWGGATPSASMYYDGAVVLASTATGVTVTGNISVTGTVDGIDIATDVAANTAASHAESHSVASHSDTTATGAELNELTDGSVTTLHSHAGGGSFNVNPASFSVSGVHNITTTESTVVFDTEDFDPDTNYSNSSGEITVTDAGYYTVAVNVPINDDGTSGTTRGRVFGFLQRDQTTSTWLTVNNIRGQVYEREASGGTGFHAGGIVVLAAGELIRFRITVSSTVDVSTESGECCLNIHKIRDI